MLSALGIALIATPAAAQQRPCGPADQLPAFLAEQYAEAVTGAGTSNGRLVLLYSNPETGTWTVAMVDPQSGLACLIGAGEDWEVREYVAPASAGNPS